MSRPDATRRTSDKVTSPTTSKLRRVVDDTARRTTAAFFDKFAERLARGSEGRRETKEPTC